MRTLVCVLALAALAIRTTHGQEWTPEERELAAEATKAMDQAGELCDRGAPQRALELFRKALDTRTKLYPASKYPDGHAELADAVNALGYCYQLMGAFDKAQAQYEQALAMRRRLYPPEKYPNGHSDLAVSLNNCGVLLQMSTHPGQALPYFEEAVAMYRKFYTAVTHPNGQPDLASGLENIGATYLAMGEARKALPRFEQALEMNRKLYPVEKFPVGHPNLARCLQRLGSAYQDLGLYEAALPYCEQSLAMNRRLFPRGHPNLVDSLNDLASLLMSTGATEEAVKLFTEALELARRLYPREQFPGGHPQLANSLDALGLALTAAGAPEQAIPLHEQALEMKRKVFPPSGHPQVAIGLNNLAGARFAAGRVEEALPLLEQALAMKRRFYPIEKFPNGHPDLAFAVNNLGGVLQEFGKRELARPYLEEALAMRRKIYDRDGYPDGHLELASSMNNLGNLLVELGDFDAGQRLQGEAVAMLRTLFSNDKFPDGHPALAQALGNFATTNRKLGQLQAALALEEESLGMLRLSYPASGFPAGHPNLIKSLGNLGSTHLALGRREVAAERFAEALAMETALARRSQLTASESDALDQHARRLRTLDAYLSVTRAESDAAPAYRAVWDTKASLTRLLAQRQAAARVAASGRAATLNQLKAVRRRIDRLLQDRRVPTAERDELMTNLSGERDRLERDLAAALSRLSRAAELDSLGPAELAELLPKKAILIDVAYYRRHEFEGDKLVVTPAYVAFLITRERPVRRVELGDAAPIDAAVVAWRKAIESRADSPAAADLARRVWAPLAAAIPPGTTWLYVSPDGDLSRLPWAALPLAKDRVLLDDFALALTPHGPFLLEQLKYPRRHTGTELSLTVGGVDYGASDWPKLAGTLAEAKSLAAVAPGELKALAGDAATPAVVATLLPKARWAHLATHGEFRAEELAAERRRAAELAETRAYGDESRVTTHRNPLGFVGIVLSGGETLSGLSVLDLDLDNVRLVTLSACDTGLGELTGGKGVENLLLAFHLAGAQNVVASLWKVNDAATAALMTKFYHELWINKKPPIEALREAQLTIYRRPDLVADLAGERGAVKLKEAVETRASGGRPTADARRRAETKLWAAFSLSGVGK